MSVCIRISGREEEVERTVHWLEERGIRWFCKPFDIPSRLNPGLLERHFAILVEAQPRLRSITQIEPEDARAGFDTSNVSDEVPRFPLDPGTE